MTIKFNKLYENFNLQYFLQYKNSSHFGFDILTGEQKYSESYNLQIIVSLQFSYIAVVYTVKYHYMGLSMYTLENGCIFTELFSQQNKIFTLYFPLKNIYLLY